MRLFQRWKAEKRGKRVKIPSVFPVLMKIIIKKNCTYCLTEQVSAIL